MIRVRLYKTTTTYDGFPVEIALLDVPLDTKRWSKRDDAALARLEQAVAPRATGVVDPIDQVRPK